METAFWHVESLLDNFSSALCLLPCGLWSLKMKYGVSCPEKDKGGEKPSWDKGLYSAFASQATSFKVLSEETIWKCNSHENGMDSQCYRRSITLMYQKVDTENRISFMQRFSLFSWKLWYSVKEREDGGELMEMFHTCLSQGEHRWGHTLRAWVYCCTQRELLSQFRDYFPSGISHPKWISQFRSPAAYFSISLDEF